MRADVKFIKKEKNKTKKSTGLNHAWVHQIKTLPLIIRKVIHRVLFASDFFNGKRVISHATSPYPVQTNPCRWVLNNEASNPYRYPISSQTIYPNMGLEQSVFLFPFPTPCFHATSEALSSLPD